MFAKKQRHAVNRRAWPKLVQKGLVVHFELPFSSHALTSRGKKRTRFAPRITLRRRPALTSTSRKRSEQLSQSLNSFFVSGLISGGNRGSRVGVNSIGLT